MAIVLQESLRAVFYAPFYAAQALGFYAREGVEIELVTSSAPGGGPAALVSGGADITAKDFRTWAGTVLAARIDGRVVRGIDRNC